MRRRMMALALAVAAVAGASACQESGGGGGEETLPSGEATLAPQPTAGGEATAQPASPPAGDGVLVSREVQDQGSTLRIDVTGLARRGQSLTLTWRITVTEAGGAIGWLAGTNLGSGGNDQSVAGVTLVDPVNAQRYLVARSGGEDGECACTQTGFYMKEGDSVEFFATYSAPPPDVTIINVEFPLFGAFTDVPIS